MWWKWRERRVGEGARRDMVSGSDEKGPTRTYKRATANVGRRKKRVSEQGWGPNLNPICSRILLESREQANDGAVVVYGCAPTHSNNRRLDCSEAT